MRLGNAREARHDPKHADAAHKRWVAVANRDMADPSYDDAWRTEQCGMCTFWVPLAGDWGLDWGACTNPASPFDRRAQFEHDGCEHFKPAQEWANPEEPELRFTRDRT